MSEPPTQSAVPKRKWYSAAESFLGGVSLEVAFACATGGMRRKLLGRRTRLRFADVDGKGQIGDPFVIFAMARRSHVAVRQEGPLSVKRCVHLDCISSGPLMASGTIFSTVTGPTSLRVYVWGGWRSMFAVPTPSRPSPKFLDDPVEVSARLLAG